MFKDSMASHSIIILPYPLKYYTIWYTHIVYTYIYIYSFKVVPPSLKFVYKPFNYRYVKFINHSELEIINELS